MQTILINATQSDELRVAIVDKKKHQLIDLDIEKPGQEQKKSNIYKGKISSIERSLGAVFIDYGSDKHGFLPIKDISKEYFLTEKAISHDMDISKILKVGQELVVQIDKEERGNKGAALTTFISLAGSYLVLMPNNPRAGGISRRIEGEDRDHLRNALEAVKVPEGMGIIIRTAGVGRNAEELNWDMEVLLRYWEAIKKAAVARPGPYLIHQESDVVIRAVRDYLKHNIDEIIIDDPNTFSRVKNYIAQVRPDYLDRLKLYESPLPLFSQFHIEQQIEQAFQREVRLPSGGSIVIDHSEALVAIDINSARATKGGNIEETAFNTNMEAAVEIPRQLRIRDIGGLVVIDFIDMISNSNQRAVEDRVREAVKQDRARIQISKISRFGLLEMSRQRINSSLNKNTQISCTHCHGRGTIRNVESLTLSILRLIEEESVKAGSAHIQVQLPIDNATFLLNEKRNALNAIQAQTQTQIVIIANPHLQSPHYSLKLIKDEHGKNTLSYKQVKLPKADGGSRRATKSSTTTDAPAINQFLSDQPHSKPPRIKKSSGESLIKRIWDTIFGLTEETGPTADKKSKKTPPKRKPAASRQQRSSSQARRAPRPERSEEKTKDANKKTANKATNSRRGNRGGRSANAEAQTKKPTENKRRQPNKRKNPASTRKPQQTKPEQEAQQTSTPSSQAVQSQPAQTKQQHAVSKPTPVNQSELATDKQKENIAPTQASTPVQSSTQKPVPVATTKTASSAPATKANVAAEQKAPIKDTDNKSKAPNYAKPEDYMRSSSETGSLKQIKTQKTKHPSSSIKTTTSED